MGEINLIVTHCSVAREDRCFTERNLEERHRKRGFEGAGCYFYICKSGKAITTQPVERTRTHAKGFNAHSIGIYYERGLDCNGRPKDTRTEWQKHSMRVLVKVLLKECPGNRVCGRRDLSPDLNGNGEIEPEEWTEACPYFEIEEESF